MKEEKGIAGSYNLVCVDLGSNSVRAVVAKLFQNETFITLETYKESLRLESHIDSDGNLNLEAQDQLVRFLNRVKNLAAKHSAQVRVCATHAIREAKNCQEVARFLFMKTGLTLEIVSGKEEARLVFLGVNYHHPCPEPTLVLDIGGGSSEVYVGTDLKESFSTSLKLGAVRLTRNFLFGKETFESDVAVLQSYINSRLEPLAPDILNSGFKNCFGTSGTIRSVKAIAQYLRPVSSNQTLSATANTNTVLTKDEIELVFQALLKAPTLEDNLFNGTIDVRRAEIILAGVMILRGFTRMAHVERWTLSMSGVREGLVIDSMSRESLWKKGNLSDIRFKSALALCQKFQVDENYSWHVMRLSLQLFDDLRAYIKCELSFKEYLRAAALLHEVGKIISLNSYHKHGEYLVTHSSISGFNNAEIALIATIVRLHRKRVPPKNSIHFSSLGEDVQAIVMKLSCILRLCVSLDRMHSAKVKKIGLKFEKKDEALLLLHSEDTELNDEDLFDLEREKLHFEILFKIKLKIQTTVGRLN